MVTSRTARAAFLLGALLAAADVALRAWAAHGLAGQLDAEGLRLFDLARGHAFHCALGLLIVGLYGLGGPGRLGIFGGAAALAFAIGLSCFSGDLYRAAFRADHATLGTAPFGGTATILAWLLLAADVLRNRVGAGTQIRTGG